MDIIKLLKNTQNKVLLYGDILIDEHVNIKTNRISSEFPVPVYEKVDEFKILGGAGNVLNNLINFNIDTVILTILNDRYTNFIEQKNIINIKDETYKNIKKRRYFSNHFHCFRVDDDNNYIMKKEIEDKFIEKIDTIISNFNYILISDYNTGIVNKKIVYHLIKKANEYKIPTIIDPKNYYEYYKNCFLIKPNKNDAEIISNIKINNIRDAEKACDIINKKLNSHSCLITLGEKGCVFKNKDVFFYEPCHNIVSHNVLDVTGAGDTFISGICLGLINSLDFKKICNLCNLFCSDIIKRKNVSTVNIITICKKKYNIINTIEECIILKKYLKNKKIVFTSGCFDLVHEGHIKCLHECAKLGDILIVALNTDISIKNLKGQERPINNLKTRLKILSSIKYVDFIVTFSDNTPNKILELIKPDILVKGGDYSYDKIKKIFPSIKENQYVSIPLIENISTSIIINKINQEK
tara:strand:+ start:2394 stop:3794 length:1401 start_codon:yes stop_codon:yes gene_type:complete